MRLIICDHCKEDINGVFEIWQAKFIHESVDGTATINYDLCIPCYTKIKGIIRNEAESSTEETVNQA